MVNEHTPGPWAWDSRGDKCHDVQVGIAINGKDEQRGGFIPEDNDLIYIAPIAEVTSDNPHADAALIAAAPELLRMLEVLEARYGSLNRRTIEDDELWADVREAIATAKGVQP